MLLLDAINIRLYFLMHVFNFIALFKKQNKKERKAKQKYYLGSIKQGFVFFFFFLKSASPSVFLLGKSVCRTTSETILTYWLNELQSNIEHSA